MLREAEEVCETEKESRDQKHMLEDYKISLYPHCNQGHKKLGTTLELLQSKTSNDLSDKGLKSFLNLEKKPILRVTHCLNNIQCKKGCLSSRIGSTEDTTPSRCKFGGHYIARRRLEGGHH